MAHSRSLCFYSSFASLILFCAHPLLLQDLSWGEGRYSLLFFSPKCWGRSAAPLHTHALWVLYRQVMCQTLLSVNTRISWFPSPGQIFPTSQPSVCMFLIISLPFPVTQCQTLLTPHCSSFLSTSFLHCSPCPMSASSQGIWYFKFLRTDHLLQGCYKASNFLGIGEIGKSWKGS